MWRAHSGPGDVRSIFFFFWSGRGHYLAMWLYSRPTGDALRPRLKVDDIAGGRGPWRRLYRTGHLLPSLPPASNRACHSGRLEFFRRRFRRWPALHLAVPSNPTGFGSESPQRSHGNRWRAYRLVAGGTCGHFLCRMHPDVPFAMLNLPTGASDCSQLRVPGRYDLPLGIMFFSSDAKSSSSRLRNHPT
jgi:hypothetical protein